MLLWYRIERVLGQGAFGITYLATDSNLHRPVAIKEYLPSQLSFREDDGSVLALTEDLTDEYGSGLRRFIAEGRTLAKFEHPSIVRVHNVFEANRTAYMVMQYEEGEDLAQILKRRRILDETEILHVLHPLLAGLEAIHAQGFVHRDIKPGNIFIRRDGTPLLLDFGAAREAAGGEARTLTNFVSPGYAPIEQYAGKSDQQGPWSDIYGLGATIYRAMTGRAPIDAVERSHALAQESSDSYQTGAQNAQGNYSAALLAAVDHALRFRTQDRPQSIAEWRRELPPASAVATVDLFAATAPATRIHSALAAPTLMLTLPSEEEQPPSIRTEVLIPSPPTQHTDPEIIAPDTGMPGTPGRPVQRYLFGFAALVIVAIAGGAWLGRSLNEGPTGEDVPLAATTATGPPMEAQAPAATAGQSDPTSTPVSAPHTPFVTPDPEQQRLDRIAELLYGASLDLGALRLTSPKGQNAHEKYREILALQPNHPAATRGIEAISDRYVGLVYRDLDANQLARAETYLDKAESLAPARPAVVEARQALEAHRQAAVAPRQAPATSTSTPDPAPSRMDRFRQRFEDFAREQQREQRPLPESRSDQFIDRLGGGR